MSNLKSLVSAPLASAILIAAVSLGAVAPAEASSLQIKTSGPVQVQEIGYRGGYYGGHHWRGDRPGRWDRLGPREIRRSLRHRGFHRIRIVDERGPVYVVKARGWRGAPVRLVVNAFNGQILRQHVIDRRGGWGRRW